MNGGFRDVDEDNFNDLLPSSSTLNSYSSYQPQPLVEPHEDDDLSTNPFADMASSRAIYQEFARESAPEPETPSSSHFIHSLPSTYDTPPPPPEEQTPFGSPPSSPTATHSLATPASPAPAPPSAAPLSPSSPTRRRAIASSPTRSSRPPPHARQPSLTLLAAEDMSDLLGEEKPLLPSFKRRDPSGTENMFRDKPGSGIPPGRTVGGPLATLLGLQEDKPKVELVTSSVVPAVRTTLELESPEKEAGTEATLNTTSAPPSFETEPQVDVDVNVAAQPTMEETIEMEAEKEKEAEKPKPTLPVLSTLILASSTPLPPSPSDSPPLSRASSFAQSSTTSEAESEPSAAAYASVVSPLYTGDSNDRSWSNNGVEALGGKLEALNTRDIDEEKEIQESPVSSTGTLPIAASVAVPSTPPRASISSPTTGTLPAPSSQSPFGGTSEFSPIITTKVQEHDDAFTSSTSPTPVSRTLFDDAPLSPTHSRGFRSYNGTNGDDHLGGHAGGHGGKGFRSYNGSSVDDGRMDDADSLRGTYSRSVEVEEDQSTETGRSSPVTDREREREGRESTLTVPLESDDPHSVKHLLVSFSFFSKLSLH